jgi:hypothetical protein
VRISETSEHLHLLATLNYYSRLRFITNLLSLIQDASVLRRVITVGGGSQEGPLDATDFPALRVPLSNLKGHLSSLITLGLETVGKTAPEVSFVHDYPGTVRTPFLNYMPEEMLQNLVFVPVDESGERHLYLATSMRFPALKDGNDGLPLRDGDELAVGTTGEIGSGMYSVGSDCESASPEVRYFLAGMREKGMMDEIWKHTEAEFKRITGLGEGL